MGTALRKLKKSGVVDEDGHVVKFKGRLTDKAIKALNVYCGGAIRNSEGSVDAMVKASFDVYRRTPTSCEVP